MLYLTVFWAQPSGDRKKANFSRSPLLSQDSAEQADGNCGDTGNLQSGRRVGMDSTHSVKGQLERRTSCEGPMCKGTDGPVCVCVTQGTPASHAVGKGVKQSSGPLASSAFKKG